MHESLAVPAVAATLALGLVSGCRGEMPEAGGPTPSASPGAVDSAALPARNAALQIYQPAADGCGRDGSLRGQLYGAVRARLDWQATDMSCEGMPRPHGEGARLRFSGALGDELSPIAIIIAMPTLERGEPRTSIPSNVTIIEEGRGRFFSSADLDTCWTDVDSQSGMGDDAVYRIEGILYCIAPLLEVGGDTSVSIDELTFVGRLGWGS